MIKDFLLKGAANHFGFSILIASGGITVAGYRQQGEKAMAECTETPTNDTTNKGGSLLSALTALVSWFRGKPKQETYHFYAKCQISSGEIQYIDGLIRTDRVSFDVDFNEVRRDIGNAMNPPCDDPIILSLTKVS